MIHKILLERKQLLFDADLLKQELKLSKIVKQSKFLIIGGAGTIGQAVALEIFKRKPRALHVVDISENNLVELVREIRSSMDYETGDFRTFAIDCNSMEFDCLFKDQAPYDYVFNLSALKHVRSEKDPYTLMRMIQVNVVNTIKSLEMCQSSGVKKYFSVSTDKAANPVNMMGASKKIMEMFMMNHSVNQNISLARFANVAFSDGSLLHGFNQRFSKRQPISAPSDIRRYFMTPQEAGELCLLSGLLGNNRDIFFPKVNAKFKLLSFSDLAVKYLRNLGYEPYECETEDEARRTADKLISKKQWPCYFFKSDTTGEKPFEEFYTGAEILDMDSFQNIGIIKNEPFHDTTKLKCFLDDLQIIRNSRAWTKQDLLTSFKKLVPDFEHHEKGKYLDQRM
tara:strand:- start:11898 stop:13085 length:1188 start_codon:yes stop_codon:yes gene_type:complete